MTETLDTHQDLSGLIHETLIDGVDVEALDDWLVMDVRALLLNTQSGAMYLIEPQTGSPSLVTRLSEQGGPLVDSDGPRLKTVIIRFEGNPDQSLRIGKSMDVLGLSRSNPAFDPDSLYTTTPLTRIRYLTSDF